MAFAKIIPQNVLEALHSLQPAFWEIVHSKVIDFKWCLLQPGLACRSWLELKKFGIIIVYPHSKFFFKFCIAFDVKAHFKHFLFYNVYGANASLCTNSSIDISNDLNNNQSNYVNNRVVDREISHIRDFSKIVEQLN